MNKNVLIDGLKKRDRDQRERRRLLTPEPPAVQPEEAFDFSRLAAHKQLRMMTAAAEFSGISSPFFQVHEGCAGATATI